MTKVKIVFDKRQNSKTKDKKFPLVLRLGHASKTRDIPLNLHLKENQYSFRTGRITGIPNAVRYTKRTNKLFSDIDLWLDENASEISYWDINRLKSEIEQTFLKKSPSRTILNHGAKYLSRLRLEGRFSTASSYEDALKSFVKYIRHRKGLKVENITTLYELKDGKLTPLDSFLPFDMEIKAFDYGFAKDFNSYLINKYASKNTPAIILRSLQAIMNDAGKTYQELRDHKPLSHIKKKSHANPPAPISLEDIQKIRNLNLVPHTPIWDNRNYMLFMFNNMGMNFFDMAILKRSQFTENRIKYYRKKTHYEGDYFSVLQNEESLEIINHYLNGQEDHEYLFPIIPNSTPEERIFNVNKGKVKIFNQYGRRIAKMAGIDKKITTYTLRDTWTNIGLDMGIDIRKISSGLGHSSVQVTERHYGKSISEKILDEINAQITSSNIN